MSMLWIAAFLALHVSLMSASDCSKPLDLGLVVDTTRSIQQKNVPFVKRSLKQLLRKFEISKNATRVSLETFADESKLHNTFKDETFHSLKAMEALIQERINKLSAPTRLDKALFKAKNEMFREENGDRAGVPSVMALYTDGKSHPSSKNFLPAVISLREKGVRILVVAVGKFAIKNKYRAELKKIAGGNVIFVDDYKNLTSTTDDIISIICPPSPCQESSGLDVAFLVDRTQSLRLPNFRLLKGFLLELIDALNVGPNATHVGLILFARTAKVVTNFVNSDYHSNEAMRHRIESIPDKLGSRTYIDRALEAANTTLFTEDGGDRPEFPNVLVLMTDGRTNKNSKNYSEIIPFLQEKKVHIAAVGIGERIFAEDLEEITGNKEHVYHVDSITRLPDLFKQILTEVCSVDGRFSRWSFWSECSKTCNGVQTRTRTCTNPSPRGRGEGCLGSQQETRACTEGPCYLQKRGPEVNGFKLSVLKKSEYLKRLSARGTE